MVFNAIWHLRDTDIPSKKPPSERWFQLFISTHSDLFHVIKTKPIARVRVAAQDIETVEQWFSEYNAWCKDHKIEPQHIYNFDESGFRIGIAPGEEVIVPSYVK